MTVQEIQRRLRSLADTDKAKILLGFFKTGPRQYGEGDTFIGVTVPVLRKLAKEFGDTSVDDAVLLLKSPIHEERLLALLMLAHSYATGGETVKKNIQPLYRQYPLHKQLGSRGLIGAEYCGRTSRKQKQETALCVCRIG
jgi:hypothetical protein